MSRREFVRSSVAAAVGTAVAACQPQTVVIKETVPVEVVETVLVEKTVRETVIVEKVVRETVVVEATPTPAPDRQAPQWVALVESGELPPLEERLPADVEVVQPLERLGEYGGSIRTVFTGATYQLRSVYGPEGFLRPDWDNETIIPNFVKAWEQPDDGKSFTFYFRKEAKWSDGEPFAADNMMYWWEDYILNEDLVASPWSWLRPGGEEMEVEKVDDYTVTWKFSVPYPFLYLRMSHADGVNQLHRMQSHYLKQFHADYADKAELDKMIQEADLEEWPQLYNRMRANSYGMPQDEDRGPLPNVLPYRFKERQDPLRVFDRNPYYWKTDPAGNQLPYIDQVIATNVESAESADAMISAGEVNFSPAFVATLASYPLYRQHEATGHYVTRLYSRCEATDVCYQPNHTVNDPVLKAIFNDVRFKRALSHALDRETINRVVYQGLGAPVQTHLVTNSKYFVEEYEQAYVEYDPDTAEALLDEAGLDQKDSEGFRIRPDGERLVININYFPLEASHTTNAELVKEMWEAVSIQVNLQSIAGDALGERVRANEIEFGLWHADKCTDMLFPFRPEWFVPYGIGWERCWGIEWARWYTTSGEEGEEPPEEILRLFDVWEQMQTTMDEYDQVFLGREILKSQAENLWTIGTVGHLPEPVIVGDNLVNVPETGWTGFDYLNTYPYHSEQFSFEGGKWSGEPK
jgi:peptide/nickel transport system substrate-binding protein